MLVLSSEATGPQLKETSFVKYFTDKQIIAQIHQIL